MKHNSFIGVAATASALLILLAGAGCATAPKGAQAGAAKSDDAFRGVELALIGGTQVDVEPCSMRLPPVSASMRAVLAGASACARASDWKATERFAGELARRDVASPWAPYFMSLAAGAANDGPRALWMAELAQKKAGREVPLFRYQRGRALLALGQTNDAFADIRAASKADSRLIEAHLYVGATLLRDQDAKGAEESYRRALAADARNGRAARGLASALAAQGDDAGAKRVLAGSSAERGGQHARNEAEEGDRK